MKFKAVILVIHPLPRSTAHEHRQSWDVLGLRALTDAPYLSHTSRGYTWMVAR